MLVGILDLQGSVIEHQMMLDKLHVDSLRVKTPADLAQIDGLIIPGGESTTIAKLLKIFNLLMPLKKRLAEGMPCYGTCAGMILLATMVENGEATLKAIDIKVVRNAYGRQLASFKTSMLIPAISKSLIPLVFIRAPWIESVGADVKVLASLDNHIIAARNHHVLVTSFHPELTDDLTIHQYFINMMGENKNDQKDY